MLKFIKKKLFNIFHSHDNFPQGIDPFYGHNSLVNRIRIDYQNPPTYYKSVYLNFYKCRCGKIIVTPYLDFIDAYKNNQWFRSLYICQKIAKQDNIIYY